MHITPDKKSVIIMDNGDTISSVVLTDPSFAKRIIDHFTPQIPPNAVIIDPCAGNEASGAFYDNFPATHQKEWCEIRYGRDFYQFQPNPLRSYFTFANPQWQGKYYAPFVNRCMQVSDNVVILAKLFGVLGTQRRLRDIKNNNFGIKEIILCDWKDANFTYLDGSAKLGEGFLLSVVHLQRGYNDGTHWNYSWTKMKNETDVKQWNKDSQYVKSKNGKLSTRTKYQ